MLMTRRLQKRVMHLMAREHLPKLLTVVVLTVSRMLQRWQNEYYSKLEEEEEPFICRIYSNQNIQRRSCESAMKGCQREAVREEAATDYICLDCHHGSD